MKSQHTTVHIGALIKTATALSLAVIISFVAGCDKAPNTETSRAGDPKPQVKAEPFHGEVYRPLRGDTVLTLVSPDECELRQGQRTLLCKYTKQPDALRVVITALGTTEVIYYKFTDQGLQSENGDVLFSTKIRAERIAKINALIAESQKKTEPIFKFKLRSRDFEARVIGEAEVTSNGMSFNAAIGQDSTKRFEHWFGNLREFSVGGTDGCILEIRQTNGGYQLVVLKDRKEAEDVLVRLSRIFSDWKKRYQAIEDEGR